MGEHQMGWEGCWKEGAKHQIIFCARDNSPLDKLQEKVDVDSIQFAGNDECVNLGIRRVNGRIYAGNYVGLCRLKAVDGKRILSRDGREVILKIEPRFQLSVVEMLHALRWDDEFERYLAPQTIRINAQDRELEDLKDNELFHFFDCEDPIYIEDNTALQSSIITAAVFLSLLKNLCTRPLMGKMITREENLVGKLKGNILFKKNIRLNTLRGRDDRIYCRYLQYSEDILENRVLKAALQKAVLFLNKYLGQTSANKNSFRDMIAYCQNALSHVSYTRITRQDLGKIKTTGCYVYYKPVINAAKMVLNEITLEANGESAFTSYVVPYAVSMNKLFEMYVRSYLKRAGVETDTSQSDQIRILKYDYKSKVLAKGGGAYSSYIGGTVKPDIILYHPKTGKYLVFDVKYKSLSGGKSARGDRLQVLAYALLYDCENVGIIFPSLSGEESRYYEKNPIESAERRKRYYTQLEIAIDTEWSFEVASVESGAKISLLQYLKGLME